MFYAIAINKNTNRIRVSAGCHNAAAARELGCKTAKQAEKRVAEIDKNSSDEYAVIEQFESDDAAFDHCQTLNAVKL
jgi:quinol monooxygenase YgiN